MKLNKATHIALVDGKEVEAYKKGNRFYFFSVAASRNLPVAKRNIIRPITKEQTEVEEGMTTEQKMHVAARVMLDEFLFDCFTKGVSAEDAFKRIDSGKLGRKIKELIL